MAKKNGHRRQLQRVKLDKKEMQKYEKFVRCGRRITTKAKAK